MDYRKKELKYMRLATLFLALSIIMLIALSVALIISNTRVKACFCCLYWGSVINAFISCEGVGRMQEMRRCARVAKLRLQGIRCNKDGWPIYDKDEVPGSSKGNAFSFWVHTRKFF